MQQSANQQVLIPGLGLVDSQSASANRVVGGKLLPPTAAFTQTSSAKDGPPSSSLGWQSSDHSHASVTYPLIEDKGGIYANASAISHRETCLADDDTRRQGHFVPDGHMDHSSKKPPLPPLPPPRSSPHSRHERHPGHFVKGSVLRQGYASPPLPPGPPPQEAKDAQGEWVDPTKNVADESKGAPSKSESVDQRLRRNEPGTLDIDRKKPTSPYLIRWDGSKMDADGQFFEAYCDRDIDEAMFSSRAVLFKKKNLNTAKSSITKKQPRSGPMKISLKKSKKKI